MYDKLTIVHEKLDILNKNTLTFSIFFFRKDYKNHILIIVHHDTNLNVNAT